MNITDKAVLRRAWEVGRLIGVDLDIHKEGEFSYRLVHERTGKDLEYYGNVVYTIDEREMGPGEILNVLAGMELAYNVITGGM